MFARQVAKRAVVSLNAQSGLTRRTRKSLVMMDFCLFGFASYSGWKKKSHYGVLSDFTEQVTRILKLL